MRDYGGFAAVRIRHLAQVLPAVSSPTPRECSPPPKQGFPAPGAPPTWLPALTTPLHGAVPLPLAGEIEVPRAARLSCLTVAGSNPACGKKNSLLHLDR